jgi:hypothetical protein
VSLILGNNSLDEKYVTIDNININAEQPVIQGNWLILLKEYSVLPSSKPFFPYPLKYEWHNFQYYFHL